MATPIDNPQAVKFCNEELRVNSDAFGVMERTLRQYIADYTARGIAALVSDTQEHLDGLVVDGSATDGRTPITGNDVVLTANAVSALLAWIDGDGAAWAAALRKPAVNTQPKF